MSTGTRFVEMLQAGPVGYPPPCVVAADTGTAEAGAQGKP